MIYKSDFDTALFDTKFKIVSLCSTQKKLITVDIAAYRNAIADKLLIYSYYFIMEGDTKK